MKILIVEDTITMRHILLHMLRNLGFEDLEEAVDGAHALEVIKKHKFDLIITDMNMPRMDGFELLQAVKADQKLAHIPVMMVTCDTDMDKIKIALAAKVAGFILKPFNQQTLDKQLKRFCRKQSQSVKATL